MRYISNRSCVRFTPRTSHNQNYIYITKGPGCSSEVGLRHSGKQLLNINEALCPRGKVIHELLHTLGYVEQCQLKFCLFLLLMYKDICQISLTDSFTCTQPSKSTSYVVESLIMEFRSCIRDEVSRGICSRFLSFRLSFFFLEALYLWIQSHTISSIKDL